LRIRAGTQRHAKESEGKGDEQNTDIGGLFVVLSKVEAYNL